jgi:hypothetical protein
MPIFPTNKEAILHFGLGELKNINDIRHGYGITDKGILVWLPIIKDVVNFDNTIIGDFIRSEAVGKDAIDRWELPMLGEQGARHTITKRVLEHGDPPERRPIRSDYTDAGVYWPVLNNITKRISICVKKNNPAAEGTVKTAPGLTWLSGFAENEEQARYRMDHLEET